jgi:hypothetical protein
MREIYVKHQGYYIQELVSGCRRVDSIEQATDWGTYERAERFIEECGLKKEHCILVEQTVCYEDMIYVNDQWVAKSTVEQCNHCLKWFPIDKLTSGVVDRESGLEFYCDKCKDEVEFIVDNQKLDDEVK